MRIRSRCVALAASLLVVAFAAGAAHHELAGKLASESRPAEDRARDDDRKPAEVVAFLGIEPGMTVVDLIAAGGYYTEVLSLVVGPEGKVYAQNNQYVLQIRDGANQEAITKRLSGDRLPNVERLDREFGELGLAPDSVDAALTALNFHDIYNSRGPEVAAAFLKEIHTFLKPGGVLGLIDHHGDEGADNEKLHRIEEKHALRLAREAGFELEDVGEMLRRPGDDRTKNVFDPEIRGKTDRFVLKLRKPGPS